VPLEEEEEEEDQQALVTFSWVAKMVGDVAAAAL
jgi:hypothetical protein